MPISPQQMDVYRIVADRSLSPEEKKSRIDMVYGGATAPQGPDLRTAQVDPASIMSGSGALNDAPPAPPPVATDAGGMSAPEEPQMSVAPPVSMPPEPSGERSEATAEHAESTAAPAATPEDESEAAFNRTIGQAIADEARGRPGMRVAAHDQPVSTTVTKQAEVPEEMKEKIRTSEQAEEGLTLAQGDTEAENKEKEAAALDDQAFAQEVDENAYEFEQKAREKQLKKAQDDFAALVEDTKAQPGEWWSSKTTGQKVVTFLAALAFGLARNPDGVDQMIKEDADRREMNRGRRLNAAHERLEDLRSRLSSPDAHRQLALSMSYRAAATEMAKLGSEAQAPEIRAKAAAAAQAYETKANLLEADGWAKEHGAFQTHIAHVPEQYVGGRAPNILRAVKAGKEAGLNPEGVLRAATGGSYGSESSPDEAKRRVTFDDGSVGYVANEGSQGESQRMATAISGLKTTYGQILKGIDSPGHSIAGPEKARLDAQIAAATQQLAAMARGEGAQAKMAGETLELLKPLTGAAATETVGTDAAAKAQLQEAFRIVADQEDRLRGTLTPSPKTAPVGGHIKTLASGDSAAAEAHGARPKE